MFLRLFGTEWSGQKQKLQLCLSKITVVLTSKINQTFKSREWHTGMPMKQIWRYGSLRGLSLFFYFKSGGKMSILS